MLELLPSSVVAVYCISQPTQVVLIAKSLTKSTHDVRPSSSDLQEVASFNQLHQLVQYNIPIWPAIKSN